MSDNPLPMTDDGMPVVPGGTYWLDVDQSIVVKEIKTYDDSIDEGQFVHQLITEEHGSYLSCCHAIYGNRVNAIEKQIEKHKDYIDECQSSIVRHANAITNLNQLIADCERES